MLDKAIDHGKEHRKKYKGSKSFDRSCRNHGNCGWCVTNRTFFHIKKDYWSKQELNEFKKLITD